MKKLEEVIYCDSPKCKNQANVICWSCGDDLCIEHREDIIIKLETNRTVAYWNKPMGNISDRYLCMGCAELFRDGVITIGIVKVDCGLPVGRSQ